MRCTYLAALLTVALTPLAAAAQDPPKTRPAFEPSVSVALEHEQQVWNAVKAKDIEAFNRLVDPPFTYIDQDGMSAWEREHTAKRLQSCDLTSYTTEDAQTKHPKEGLVILSYRLIIDQTCGGVKSPSPVNVISVWQRLGDNWKLEAQTKTPVMGGK